MRVFLVLILVLPLAFSQRVVNARAGMVYYAEGVITIDGQPARTVRNRPPQIQAGQIVATPRGHAEILMGPDAILWTGAGSQVRFEETSVDDARVSLLAGSLMFEIKRAALTNRLRVQIGDHTVEMRQVGVYRFDHTPERMRTVGGEMVSIEQGLKIMRGQEVLDGSVRTFDRRDTDEFFYWAALQSLVLERDAGREQRWKRKGEREVTHSGFDLTFPSDLAAARVKYLASSDAGLVYAVDGNSSSQRLPFWIGQNNAARTWNDKAEIFLGVGIVADLAENSILRIIDARSWAPMIALERGTAVVEVTDSRDSPVLRIQLGGTVTQLLSPGVYKIDAQSETLSLYRGESQTTFTGGTIRASEGQRVNLKDPKLASPFDRKEQDPLLRWAADASFRLFTASGGLMTGWSEDRLSFTVKHKVFGERSYLGAGPRPRPQLRPPGF